MGVALVNSPMRGRERSKSGGANCSPKKRKRVFSVAGRLFSSELCVILQISLERKDGSGFDLILWNSVVISVREQNSGS